MESRSENPHVLAIPFPLQGHINPMFHFCTRLNSRGIRSVFVTTSQLRAALDVPDDDPIRIETVPDVAAEDDGDGPLEKFFASFRAAITAGIRGLLGRYGSSLKAVVYDSVMPWCLDLAREGGFRGVVLFTQPAAVCSVFYHLCNGSLEVPPEGDDESEVVLPALRGGFKRKDLPSFVYDRDSFPLLLQILTDQFSNFENAHWRVFNTFHQLEFQIIRWLSSKAPILSIGPTIPLQDDLRRSPSLFKPDRDDSSIKWLDQKPANSVVYVSFGSLADVSPVQIQEIARGLILTDRPFLWSLRESERRKLPPDFSDDANGGLIIDWCPQVRVLSHPAVRCFLTHGGWNSTLEAVCCGVPMVVLPIWGDQTMNAKLIADVWGFGLRVPDAARVTTGEEVAGLVGDVFRDEGMMRNVERWKGLALEAMAEGGSSHANLVRFVDELLNA